MKSKKERKNQYFEGGSARKNSEVLRRKRSENMWRKDRNFGRRDGNEGNTFERKEERKTILIKGIKEEDEFRQFRSKGGKKEKVLGRKADSSYDSDGKEESICGRKTDSSEGRVERKSTWKKDRRCLKKGRVHTYVEERQAISSLIQQEQFKFYGT